MRRPMAVRPGRSEVGKLDLLCRGTDWVGLRQYGRLPGGLYHPGLRHPGSAGPGPPSRAPHLGLRHPGLWPGSHGRRPHRPPSHGSAITALPLCRPRRLPISCLELGRGRLCRVGPFPGPGGFFRRRAGCGGIGADCRIRACPVWEEPAGAPSLRCRGLGRRARPAAVLRPARPEGHSGTTARPPGRCHAQGASSGPCGRQLRGRCPARRGPRERELPPRTAAPVAG